MISDQLRDACRQSGLTQQQLAAAAGTSQRAISDFLAGKGLATESLDRLAEAAGCRLVVPKRFAANLMRDTSK